MFDYIDIHSHLYFPDFDKDREDEITKLKENKIAAITVGTDFESSQKAIELAKKHENLFATVGFHPGNITSESLTYDISYVSDLADNEKVVGIGECGLDYFREAANNPELQKIQKEIFQKQTDLALEKNLPLMLHIRPQKGTMDAYLDALEILENQKKISGKKLCGNVHFFVGDMEVLKRFLAVNFTVSFTGVITFARDYDGILRATPLDMFMSETDAPFVAPVPHRGRRNSPLFVPEVVKKIAEIRGEDLEVVRRQMIENVKRVFNIK
jgi:TatD DNase family protein